MSTLISHLNTQRAYWITIALLTLALAATTALAIHFATTRTEPPTTPRPPSQGHIVVPGGSLVDPDCNRPHRMC